MSEEEDLSGSEGELVDRFTRTQEKKGHQSARKVKKQFRKRATKKLTRDKVFRGRAKGEEGGEEQGEHQILFSQTSTVKKSPIQTA